MSPYHLFVYKYRLQKVKRLFSLPFPPNHKSNVCLIHHKPLPVKLGSDARCQCQDAKMTKDEAGHTFQAQILYPLEWLNMSQVFCCERKHFWCFACILAQVNVRQHPGERHIWETFCTGASTQPRTSVASRFQNWALPTPDILCPWHDLPAAAAAAVIWFTWALKAMQQALL